MGVHPNIGIDKFPAQGNHLNNHVKVCFDYNPDVTLFGIIVRDDIEDPFRLIIALENGKYVLATECQYSIIKKS